MIYLLLCILMYTAWAVLGKIVASRLSLVDSTFYYCLGQSFVMMVLGASNVSMYHVQKVGDVAWATLYGIIGAVGIFAFNGALQWRSASFVLPVVNVAYQALALIIFVIILGESLSIKQIVGLLLMVVATGLLI